jgi:phosphoribosylcarboxyaminoimidazole (NCAIR) mutase
MKKIAIIIGSRSDLKQCLDGLKFLKGQSEFNITVYIRSQHRNTLSLQQLLREISFFKFNVIIAGAGWANHLTGCTDAFLRYELKNNFTRVIGVAFEDRGNARHTHAAILSITEVPGTQVIYKNSANELFIGSKGFLKACELAISPELDDFPDIKLPEAKSAEDLSLDEAIG